MKYSLQTSDFIRFSFGTRIPPTASAKRKKGGNNHPTYIIHHQYHIPQNNSTELTDGFRHHGKPSKSRRPSHSTSPLLFPFPLPLPLPPSNGVLSSSFSLLSVVFFLLILPALLTNASLAPQFCSGVRPLCVSLSLSCSCSSIAYIYVCPTPLILSWYCMWCCGGCMHAWLFNGLGRRRGFVSVGWKCYRRVIVYFGTDDWE